MKAVVLSAVLPAAILLLAMPGIAGAIVGGRDVVRGSFEAESVVFIPDDRSKEACTGILVAENVVLTAAHCVSRDSKRPGKRIGDIEDVSDLRIVFGATPNADHPQDSRRVTAIRRHEQFDPVLNETSKPKFDLAVIRFAGKRPANTRVATLAKPSDMRPNMRVMALGYGRIDGFVNDKRRPTGVGQLRAVALSAIVFDTASPEFTVLQTRERGVCMGDSGGPALAKADDGTLFVAGVISRTQTAGGYPDAPDFNFCTDGGIGKFTSVAVFREWIEKATAELQRSSK